VTDGCGSSRIMLMIILEFIGENNSFSCFYSIFLRKVLYNLHNISIYLYLNIRYELHIFKILLTGGMCVCVYMFVIKISLVLIFQ
jgi:hypothetical protein